MLRLPRLTRVATSLVIILLFVALPAADTSAALLAATAPSLGTAGVFAVLGASTVTNTGPTVVDGELGLSPGTSVTNFPPGIVLPPHTMYIADAVAQQAQVDALTAYNNLASQSCSPANNLTGTDLGGLTLAPDVYCFNTSADLTGDLTLDAGGDPEAVWIFQMGSTLTTASNSSVVFINSESDPGCNVFWQVGSSATLGTGTEFAGTILADQSITLNTGASLDGRALALNAAVNLDTNRVSVPVCETATAVDLLSFGATSTRSAITLNWETASETDNLGFNVYRAEAVGGERVKLNAELIPTNVSPGSPFGAAYEYTDKPNGRANAYYYWLEDVDIDGDTELHGPVEATLARGFRLKEVLGIVLPVTIKEAAEGQTD